MEKYKVGDVVRLVDGRFGSYKGPRGKELNPVYRHFIGKEFKVYGFCQERLKLKSGPECFPWRVEPVDISLENE